MKTIKKIVKNIYVFGKDMSSHNSAAYASSVSFFFFMSMIPSLMFLFSLFRYLPLTESDLTYVLSFFIPSALEHTINGLVDSIYSSSVTVLPITAVVTLWSANMGMLGLIRGLNGVLELNDKRNYIVLRLIATIYTLLMLMGLIASLIIMGFGRKIMAISLKYLPSNAVGFANLLGFRHLIVFLVLMILFALAYTFLPAKNQNFVLSLPGASLASLGWILVTWLLSIYVDYFNGFSIYGSLTLIMVLLFWIYCCFTIFIVGAFINKYYKTAFEHRLVSFRIKREAKKEEKLSAKEQNRNSRRD